MRDWAARKARRLARRRARKEMAAMEGAPKAGVTLPWTRRGSPGGDQTLRAFIQINVLPRPK